MPGGVTVFGGDLEMIVCNQCMRDMLGFPDELFADAPATTPTRGG